MEPVLYIMAILGCGEGEVACEQVRTVNVEYASEAACTAATEAQLIRNSDVAFPLVVAQCRRVGVQPARLMPEDVLRTPPPRQQRAPQRTQIAARD